ncbi:hypothetical protein NB688_001519 [Xanthomonas sacchari]|uniref:Uncharacterized protein n=1 Tax=Xanthomonas sacchari TaxID=56458 RepID=A0ABT3DT13_9XANT|nr:hypothetical protein [Xanthomonas sacchari]MCW0419353.1 hypothetical protein [Xanthomonas sacchari]
MRSFLHQGDTERFQQTPQPDNVFGKQSCWKKSSNKKSNKAAHRNTTHFDPMRPGNINFKIDDFSHAPAHPVAIRIALTT